MAKVSLDVICNFFDELDENMLAPFDGTPNPLLPNENRRTIRIKDIFKITHYKRICRYDESELEICKSHFLTIYIENVAYVAQCSDIINKIKAIVDHEMYESMHKNSSVLTGQQTQSTNSDSNQTTSDVEDAKIGGFRGKADSTQLYTMLDSTSRVIETKNIIEKSDNKLMDFIDPNIRQHEQSVSVEKSTSTQNMINKMSQTNLSNSNSTRNTTTTRSTRAINEMQALMAKIPRLRQQFCECFRPLFLC